MCKRPAREEYSPLFVKIRLKLAVKDFGAPQTLITPMALGRHADMLRYALGGEELTTLHFPKTVSRDLLVEILPKARENPPWKYRNFQGYFFVRGVQKAS